MYTNKEMEEIFGIPFEDDKEYQKKSDKLEKLKEKYQEKFGEEIEYYPIDLGEYNIDNEIKLVEKALKDNKPFISEDSTIDGITVLGKKIEFWF